MLGKSIALLAVWLIASTAFAQPKVDVEQFQAITAKAARVEPLSDSVAVMLVDRTPGVKTGAFLTITSEAKFATPYIDAPGVTITQSQSDPKRWLLFAPTGKYRLLVIEFDPERGPKLNNVDVVIGPAPPDEPPPTDQPPTGDFSGVTKVAKEAADKLNDPLTREQLARAYKMALGTIAGKSYEDSRATVVATRFAVLNARKGKSLEADWNSWLKAVDAEITKAMPVPTAEGYRAAVSAIVKGLE